MQPLTRAESSHFTETSRHADVMAFIMRLRAASAAGAGRPRLAVGCFGTSPEGRDLPLLILSSEGVRTPAEARALGRPIVLIQSGIHAGEVEGKEACLMLVRDLLAGTHGDVLAHLTLLVVPLFNPDGNDRISPENRKLDLAKLEGQKGPPSGVGTRTNASGVNLNRDYMRQESLEMRLLQSRVCQAWEPDLTIDNHATNGSVHRFWMTYDVPHTVESGRAEPILWMREKLLPAVTAAVRSGHALESGWYGNFAEDERVLDSDGEADPASAVREGWMTYPHHPRFGSNYRGLTSRMDLLLECYAYIPFAERVRTAYAFMLETFRFVATRRDDLLQTIAVSRTPRARIAVRYGLERFAEPVEILTRTPRTLDGAPTTLRLPHLARFVGTTVVDRPAAYVVPSGVAEHLRRHGLFVEDAAGTYGVEVAMVESLGAEGGRSILEAAAFGDLGVTWRSVSRTAPAGCGLVRTDQPLGAIAVYLCEPESDDGAVENGLVPGPAVGEEFPIWRVREPGRA